MTATLELRKQGIKATDTTATYSYLLKSDDDNEIFPETNARTAALDLLPDPTSFPFASMSLDLLVDEPVVWLVEVNYGTPGGSPVPSTDGDIDFSFDIGTETRHITRSLGNIGSYKRDDAPGGDVPYDFDDYINVQDDGSVAGADILIPTAQFTLNVNFVGVISEAYQLKVKNAVTKTNSTIFRGRDIGEVLFLGATGSTRFSGGSPSQSNIQLRFAERQNQDDAAIDGFTGSTIEIRGWDLAWQYTVNEEFAGPPKSIKPKPKGFLVELIYEQTDLNELLVLT